MDLIEKWMTGRSSPCKKLTSFTLTFLTFVCFGAIPIISFVSGKSINDDPLPTFTALFLAILSLSGVGFFAVKQRQQFMEKFGFKESKNSFS